MFPLCDNGWNFIASSSLIAFISFMGQVILLLQLLAPPSFSKQGLIFFQLDVWSLLTTSSDCNSGSLQSAEGTSVYIQLQSLVEISHPEMWVLSTATCASNFIILFCPPNFPNTSNRCPAAPAEKITSSVTNLEIQ